MASAVESRLAERFDAMKKVLLESVASTLVRHPRFGPKPAVESVRAASPGALQDDWTAILLERHGPG